MDAERLSDMAGYFDLQVNGYGGIDFNGDDLTADGLHEACEKLVADGVAGALATVITDDVERMAARLARIVELRADDPMARRIIAGFHIEGPFLNRTVGYAGAHPPQHIIPADVELMNRLLDAAGGLTKIVTLAPENDADGKLTRMLADEGVTVSAGHCNPSLDQLNAAIDAGLGMFTHVGNGVPAELPRHDNIIQRAISLHEKLWLCFIADGVHVPLPALGNYLRAAGVERACVITDAVFPAGLGPGIYEMDGRPVRIGKDLAIRSPDGPHLMGSAVTMPQNYKNLTEGLGLTRTEALQLTVVNPREAIGLNGGYIPNVEARREAEAK